MDIRTRTDIACPDARPEPRIERRPWHRARRKASPVTGPPLFYRASSPECGAEVLSALDVAGSLRRSDPATPALVKSGSYIW